MRQPVENAEIMAGGPLRNTEAEPSGVRLMAFLAAHRTEVLAREQNNERFIHLYGTGGYWAAFERSAYQLCRLFPETRPRFSISRLILFPSSWHLLRTASCGPTPGDTYCGLLIPIIKC